MGGSSNFACCWLWSFPVASCSDLELEHMFHINITVYSDMLYGSDYWIQFRAIFKYLIVHSHTLP